MLVLMKVNNSLGYILIHFYYYNKTPETKSLIKSKTLFLTVLGTGNSKLKAPAGLVV